MNKKDASAFDLTKHTQAQNMLEQVLECSCDGFYITDGEANTLMVNRSYELISGLRREDLIGRNMRDLVREGVISESGTLLAIDRKCGVTLEQRFGSGKRVMVSSTPAFDEEGNIIMVVTNVRDITEIYNLKRQLSQDRALTEKQQAEMEQVRKRVTTWGKMVAVDRNTLSAMVKADRVARIDSAVLLLGETGVGKETIATYIHENSERCGGRFVEVNCGAIPEKLVESELFGSEGAGADQDGRPGLFEAAHEGTIFLDEVGELPPEVQAKLLRVMQEKEFVRAGGLRPIKADVRVIAATDRDLEELVRRGMFRKDLYYRLSVFPVTVPPLRRRREDILPLAHALLKSLNRKYNMNKELAQSAVMELQLYDWPGNIRELNNVVERAMVLSAENLIQGEDLALYTEPKRPADPEEAINLKETIERLESHYINRAYEQYGNVRRAARSLCMDAATFVRRRRKYTGDGWEGGFDETPEQ